MKTSSKPPLSPGNPDQGQGHTQGQDHIPLCASALGLTGENSGCGAPALRVTSYAEDEFILQAVARDGQTRIRVYRPERTSVVLGRGSDPDVELDAGACRADGIPVLRRRGGGCAVVIDLGNVIVSVAMAAPGLNHTRQRFDHLSDWLVRRLRGLGYHGLYRDGTFDVALADRKVGGACMYRSWNLMLFSATLLVSPGLKAIDRYVKHPPREPAYRRGRAHRDFLGGLPVDGGPERIEDFVAQLDDSLTVDGLPLFAEEATYQARADRS